jgi:hypothetical protein
VSHDHEHEHGHHHHHGDDDDVQDLQTIQLKLRHKPYGVYMKWLEGGDVGRELLFAEGQYDDKMQVRLGGRKAVLPVMKLDPNGSLAMKESRHPVLEDFPSRAEHAGLRHQLRCQPQQILLVAARPVEQQQRRRAGRLPRLIVVDE